MEKIKTLANPAGLSEAAIRLHMLKTYRDMVAQHCPNASTLLAADSSIAELSCQVANERTK